MRYVAALSCVDTELGSSADPAGSRVLAEDIVRSHPSRDTSLKHMALGAFDRFTSGLCLQTSASRGALQIGAFESYARLSRA